jgi:hypothetical protein
MPKSELSSSKLWLMSDPALVYAFQKTGVYICEENEKRLPTKSLKAFDGAVDEYFSALKRRVQ